MEFPKTLVLGLGLIMSFILGTTYAVDLNSGNVASTCVDSTPTLDCSSKNITDIATDTFVNYPDIQTLNLDNNQISSIESGDFAGLSILQDLSLTSNQISSIENGSFAGLSHITTLALYYNQISSIESGDFVGLSNLTSLNLQNNQISSIESGDFAGLSSVQYLYLRTNQISSVDKSAFNNINLSSFDIRETCNDDPISHISNKNGYTDGRYCAIVNGNYNDALTSTYNVNGTNVAKYISDGAGGYIGDRTLSFYKDNGNSIDSNTTMKYTKPDWYPSTSYYTDNNIKVFYPVGTILSQSGSAYTGNLTAPMLFGTSSVSSLNAIAVMRFGNLVGNLDFSQSITVTMPAPGLNPGDTIDIYSSNNKSVFGQSTNPWTLHQSNATVTDIGGKSYVVFTTNHASWYALGTTTALFHESYLLYNGSSWEQITHIVPGIQELEYTFDNGTSMEYSLNSRIYRMMFKPFVKKYFANPGETYAMTGSVHAVVFKTIE